MRESIVKRVSIENEIDNGRRYSTECLKVFYKRYSIILINEFDKILIPSFKNGYYENMKVLINTLFSNIFKGLTNLNNNFQYYTLLNDNMFFNCFGLTKLFLNTNIFHLMNQVKIISSQNHQIKIFIDHWIKSGEESALINILEYKNLFNLNNFIILLDAKEIPYITKNLINDGKEKYDFGFQGLIQNTLIKEYILIEFNKYQISSLRIEVKMKIDVCKIISSDQNSHNENNKILQQILIVLLMNL
ncbi:hypothetical protein H8356DRAFT_1430939 [Neocallimastix lanati (nom. inval.)]|nr:hypothetical protein H8356DRAFT_1430939 [Neocallimastix sp. JGI-2020a]